jgi:Fe2+ or Zn2+ uptake regulation protein
MQMLIGNPSDDILSVKLEQLRGFIPGVLLNKLLRIGLLTIHDYLDFAATDFSRLRYVGERSLRVFMEFKNKIYDEPSSFFIYIQKHERTPVEKIGYNQKKLDYLISDQTPEYNIAISNHKILNLKIAYVKRLIPGMLYTKFRKLGLITISDIFQVDNKDFLLLKGSSIQSLKTFIDFKAEISQNSDEIYNLYISHLKKQFLQGNLTTDLEFFTQLPLSEPPIESGNFLDSLAAIVTDYASLKTKNNSGNILLQAYGINQHKHSKIVLASKNSISPERIRQIVKSMLVELKQLCNGQKSLDICAFFNPNFVESYKATYLSLVSNSYYSFQSIEEFFISENHERLPAEKENLLVLFIDIAFKTTLWLNDNKKKQKIIFAQEQKNRRELIDLENLVKKILRQSSIPLTEKEIFARVLKKQCKAQKLSVKSILQLLPEISVVDIENQTKYKIKKSRKMLNRDRVYEMLKQGGKVMSMEEILNAMNATITEPNKVLYTRFDLDLAPDRRFKSLQKTGFWSLTEWGLNHETYHDLVLNTIKKINRPASGSEIYSAILTIRPQAKFKSIKNLVGFLCTTIVNLPHARTFKDRIYVLPEWENRYPKYKFKPKIKLNNEILDYYSQVKSRIISIINSTETKQMRATEIVKKIMSEYPDLSKITTYHFLNNKNLFSKIYDSNSQKCIRVKE